MASILKIQFLIVVLVYKIDFWVESTYPPIITIYIRTYISYESVKYKHGFELILYVTLINQASSSALKKSLGLIFYEVYLKPEKLSSLLFLKYSNISIQIQIQLYYFIFVLLF